MNRPLLTYEPTPILDALYKRFFEHIEVDEAWVSAVRDAEKRGTVVYVLRNLSFVDFLALDHLTRRFNLPRVRFANDMGLWLLEPMGRGWLRALQKRTEIDDAEDLRRTIARGCSAALFLKRPPSLLDASSRGQVEGDAFVRTLLDVQRTQAAPILLVPQVFVWTRRPDEARHTAMDAILGPREWPGKVRTVAQFLLNYRHVTLRAGEPLDLRALLSTDTQADTEAQVRRITYALLRRLERERRSVVGPLKKPADRLRSEVVRSPKLRKVIGEMAGEGEAERRVLTARAMGMLREMEARPEHNAVLALEKAFDGVFSRMYTALEVDEAGLAKVREASKDGTLILLPSHKSHIDYLILSYVFFKHHLQLPVIAAGDNLNFFPLGTVFRHAGAFFIRRSFHGDRLYAAVVDAYMRRLVMDGWPIEFFLEGGRSRTGKTLPPKFGLLSIVVDAALQSEGQNVYFCPISIGYERMVEERAYVQELTGGEKKKEDVRGLLSSIEVLLSRYGRVNIQFGEPITIASVLEELGDDPARASTLSPPRRRSLIMRLGHRAMFEINDVTAVTPGALVATALLVHKKRGIAHPELVQSCQELVTCLQGFGARLAPSLASKSGTIRTEALREACELFARAGHVHVHLPGEPIGGKERVPAGPDAIYTVPDDARMSLDFAKNLLMHFFVSRGLIATAIMAQGGTATDTVLRERVLTLSRLFKYEFQFRADATFDVIFEETLRELIEQKQLIADRGQVTRATGPLESRIELYANMMRNFVEAYRVAARGLGALLRGPLAPKELAKRTLATGDRMFMAGDILRREAISRPIFENAQSAFVDQGYLTRQDGKLALAETFSSAQTVQTIEAKIARFLPSPEASHER